MAYSPQDIDQAVEVANAKGLVVCVPRDNEAFVDIDREEDLAEMMKILPIISKNMRCTCRKWPSPSREPGHWHVLVTFERTITEVERIALQAILCSDRKREAISFGRREQDEVDVSRFFETREDAERFGLLRVRMNIIKGKVRGPKRRSRPDLAG